MAKSIPFKWDKTPDDKYHFEDDSENEYLVEFVKKSKGKYELKFFGQGEHWGEWTLYVLTGGNIFRITETIFGDILNDFIKSNNPSEVFICGLGREKEREYVTSRTKVYHRYLERNPITGYSLTLIGNNIYVRKEKNPKK